VSWRTSKALIGSCFVLSVSACQKAPSSPLLATVDDVSIDSALLDAYALRQVHAPAADLDAARRAALLRELTSLAAAAGQAETSLTVQDKAALSIARMEQLAQLAARRSGVYQPPTEVEIDGAYQQFVREQPAQEFHVAHILVPTESSAQLLIVKLQSGQDFATLAREQSADDSKGKGGDIGWLSPGKLPVEFTDAVASLKVGEVTKKPVHTKYGWHVIKLLESRSGKVPPLEAVRAQLVANIGQAKYQAFLQGAAARARVTKTIP
jgi:peptidyl-prolyl cis-trans isomerase C